MSEQAQNNNASVQANSNSNAVGSISAGGDISGNIHVGNIGYSSEDVAKLLTQITSMFQPKPFDGTCPYKGLDVFEEEDAELFFGREKLVEELVGRVKASRTVFITGPSGSGKSSLVRAGLIPALKQGQLKGSERWLYATMKPGRDPFEALAVAFSRLKSPELGKYFREHSHQPAALNECAESALSERKDQRLVLFIDQFEEVFTQVSKEEERIAFLNLLTHAADAENGRVILLFSMRSDFVPNCAIYPELNAALNRQFIQIGAMQPDELVSAIAQPALRVGLRIDPDLIAQIINDMKGEPGALPLMSFALKDLFDAMQSKGGIIALTLNDYLQSGGIQKSLERHANMAFESLGAHEQELARSIFSGLIEVGRGTQDTKRTAIFDELIPANINAKEVETIVRKLADARLITTDESAGRDTVTISHEKLIDAWPWLKRLVNENRDTITIQNQISEDAKEWLENNKDSSYLYTGARLASAYELLSLKRLSLGNLGLEFISTSREVELKTNQEKLYKEKQVEFEKISSKRLRYLTFALITIFTLAFIGAYYWFYVFAVDKTYTLIENNFKNTLAYAVNNMDKEGFVELYKEESRNNPMCPPEKPTVDTSLENNGYYPEDNPLYIAHVSWLHKISEITPGTRVYTYIKGIDPGEIIAIGSSGYFREPRGGFRFCERYTSTSSSIYNGLFGEIKTTESYQDSFGTWITTYVPIQDKSGNIIGAMGMDVSISYVEEIKSQIRRGMLISFFSIYPILLILILLTFRANKRLMVNIKQENDDITLNAP